MKAAAYALRAEYEGTVSVPGDDGDTTETPLFTGGVLAVGDGDFHVKDQLEAGDGTIVIHQADSRLFELLEAYPALKRVDVPEGAEPISIYERQTAEALRHQAQLRQFVGVGPGKAEVIARLEAHDQALAAGDPVRAAAIEANQVPIAANDGLEQLTKARLLELVPDGTEGITDKTTNAELIAKLRELGITARS